MQPLLSCLLRMHSFLNCDSENIKSHCKCILVCDFECLVQQIHQFVDHFKYRNIPETIFQIYSINYIAEIFQKLYSRNIPKIFQNYSRSYVPEIIFQKLCSRNIPEIFQTYSRGIPEIIFQKYSNNIPEIFKCRNSPEDHKRACKCILVYDFNCLVKQISLLTISKQEY